MGGWRQPLYSTPAASCPSTDKSDSTECIAAHSGLSDKETSVRCHDTEYTFYPSFPRPILSTRRMHTCIESHNMVYEYNTCRIITLSKEAVCCPSFLIWHASTSMTLVVASPDPPAYAVTQHYTSFQCTTELSPANEPSSCGIVSCNGISTLPRSGEVYPPTAEAHRIVSRTLLYKILRYLRSAGVFTSAFCTLHTILSIRISPIQSSDMLHAASHGFCLPRSSFIWASTLIFQQFLTLSFIRFLLLELQGEVSIYGGDIISLFPALGYHNGLRFRLQHCGHEDPTGVDTSLTLENTFLWQTEDEPSKLSIKYSLHQMHDGRCLHEMH